MPCGVPNACGRTDLYATTHGASGSFEATTDASGASSILVGIFSYAPIEWSVEQVRTPDGELIPGITVGDKVTVGDAESECGG